MEKNYTRMLIFLVIVLLLSNTLTLALYLRKIIDDQDMSLNTVNENALPETMQNELETPVSDESKTNQDSITLMKEDDKLESPTSTLVLIEDSNSTKLLSVSNNVFGLFDEQNFAELSKYIDPELGLSFSLQEQFITPLTTFYIDDIRIFNEIEDEYLFGYSTGTGNEIIKRPSDYFDQYISEYFREIDDKSIRVIFKEIETDSRKDSYARVSYAFEGTKENGYCDYKHVGLHFRE